MWPLLEGREERDRGITSVYPLDERREGEREKQLCGGNFAPECFLLSFPICFLSLPTACFARSWGLAIIASLSDSPDLTKSSNLAKQKVVKEVG